MFEKNNFGKLGASSRKLTKKKVFVGILSVSMLLTTIHFLPEVEAPIHIEYYGYIHEINGTIDSSGTAIKEVSSHNITIKITDSRNQSNEYTVTTDMYGCYHKGIDVFTDEPLTINYTVEHCVSCTNTTIYGYYEILQSAPIDRRVDPTFNIINSSWEWFEDPDSAPYTTSPHSNLVVVDIRFSNNDPKEGDNITIYADIINRGDTTLGGDIKVSFYNDTHFIQNGIITNLNKDETKNTSVSWNYLDVGYHTITVKVDLDNDHLETREQWNNERNENIDVWKWISGDWNVTTTEICSNLPIVVDGNLNVKNGGNLTLTNCRLKINSSYDGEYKISVMNGGDFNFSSSSVTPYNISYPYNFEVYGTTKIIESYINFPSGNVTTGIGGVKIYSDNVKILNSWILNSKSSGIYVYEADPIIENSYFISNKGNGIYLDSSNATLENLQIAENQNYGILFNNSNSILNGSYIYNFKQSLYFAGSSNATVTNCSFAGNNNFTVNLTGNSHPIFINTSINFLKIGCEDNLSSIKIGWYLDTQAIDLGTPLDNASLQILDVYGNIVTNGTTNSEGIMNWITTFDFEQNRTIRTYFSPYTINLYYQNANTSRLVWMDHSKKINVTSIANETWTLALVKLETESVVKPHLLNLTTDFPEEENFTTLDCSHDRVFASLNNITETYNPIISYIENQSGVPLLLNGSGIILGLLKQKDVNNLSSYNGVDKVVELNRTHIFPDTSFNLTNLRNKIETINSTYNSFNTTGIINVTNLNITVQIENLTAIANGLEDVPISDSVTNISLMHTDFGSYLDSVQDYMDNMNTSTKFQTACGMAVTKVNLDALYSYLGPSTIEMHYIKGGIREVLNGQESINAETQAVDDTMGPLGQGSSNGVPFSMTYHYRSFSEDLWEFDLEQMIMMGMNWVRIDVKYEHLDYDDEEPELKLLNFIKTIDDINEEHNINFKIFMVLKPVDSIGNSNVGTAKTIIKAMLDVINNYQIEDDSTYLWTLIKGFQIMNEPPKKTWINTEWEWQWWPPPSGFYPKTSVFTSEMWMEQVVDAAKEKIKTEQKVTVNLAYPRYWVITNSPTGTIYVNINDLIEIPTSFLDPICETFLGTSPSTVGTWYEPFWAPLTSHVSVLGVDIYPEDIVAPMIDIGLVISDLEIAVKSMLIPTAAIKDFWICETPARDGMYDSLPSSVTPDDIYNYIKWEYEAGAKMISIYRIRDKGDLGDLDFGEGTAYGLFHKSSKNGHNDFILKIREAADDFGNPFFLGPIDQKQEILEVYIPIRKDIYFEQDFKSGVTGSTSSAQVFIVLSQNVCVIFELAVHKGNGVYHIIAQDAVVKPPSSSPLYIGWIDIDFDDEPYPAGTKYKLKGRISPSSPDGSTVGIGIASSNPYPDGKFILKKYGDNAIADFNADATFRTYVT